MAKIFVTGASGRLGRLLIQKLENAIPLVRKPSRLPNEIVTDFSTKELKKILANASAVVHLAGSRDFLDMKKAREGNVELTRRILEAMPDEAKIIFASSISVYGKKMLHIPADETSRANPDTAYAKTKLEAEGIVSEHPNHVILRIGPIYGPGFEEYFKVLRMLEKGRMKIIGDGKNRIPFVHVNDVVNAISNAIEHGDGIYVLVGECLSQREIYDLASSELGVEPPKKHMSIGLAKAFSQFELFRTTYFGGTPKFIPEDVAVLSSDRAFNCTKAREELGFSPIPLGKGIKEMVKLHKGLIKVS